MTDTQKLKGKLNGNKNEKKWNKKQKLKTKVLEKQKLTYFSIIHLKL